MYSSQFILIVNRSAADHKNIDIKPGDVLRSVNDVLVDENIDRYYYFSNPSIDQEIKLSFTRGTKVLM